MTDTTLTAEIAGIIAEARMQCAHPNVHFHYTDGARVMGALADAVERMARSSTSSGGVGVKAAELDDYDAGLLNDYGGGNTDWWLDYIRAEIGRANDFWREQLSALSTPALAPQPTSASVGGVSEALEWKQGEAWSSIGLLSVHQLSEHVWQTRFNGTEICRWRGTEKEAQAEAKLFLEARAALSPPPKAATTAKVGEITEAMVERARNAWKAHKGDNAAAMRAALTAAQLSPVSAPEGWVLVPKEPTNAMLSATYAVNFGNEDEIAAVHNIWNAMLASLPTVSEG